MEVADSPVVSGAEVVLAYSPTASLGAVRGRLQYLRHRRAISPGIQRLVRGQHGRVRGTIHVYSDLNREAARTLRRGDTWHAQALAERAASLEAEPSFVALVEELAAAAASARAAVASINQAPWRELQALIAAGDVIREQALLASGALVEARGSLKILAAQVRGTVEAITQVMGTQLAAIRTIQGIVSFPVAQLQALGLDRVGSAVSVEWEALDSGAEVVTASGALLIGDQPAAVAGVYERPPITLVDAVRWARLTDPHRTPRTLPPLPIPLPE
jgi:hypothetical protein